MARTTGDTMAEGLQKTLSQIAQMTALPDADVNFLMGLQTGISTYLRQGAMGATQGGNINLPPGPGAPGPANATPTPDMGGMGGMQGPAAGGPGVPPMMAGPGMGGIQPPNMDELRRALAQGPGAQ